MGADGAGEVEKGYLTGLAGSTEKRAVCVSLFSRDAERSALRQPIHRLSTLTRKNALRYEFVGNVCTGGRLLLATNSPRRG